MSDRETIEQDYRDARAERMQEERRRRDGEPVFDEEEPSAEFCPANADHKHRDAGGMFTFSCRDCGWVEDNTFGADMSSDYPRLGK